MSDYREDDQVAHVADELRRRVRGIRVRVRPCDEIDCNEPFTDVCVCCGDLLCKQHLAAERCCIRCINH